jgi:hypothetical protein
MSVLLQIIDYLRDRGLLSQEEQVELAAHGLLRWEEVYPALEAEEAAAPAPRPTTAMQHEAEEEEYGRTRDRSGRGGPGARAPALGEPELCARLAQCFGEHEAVLEGLMPLGKALGAPNWAETAIRVRKAAPEDLVLLLGHTLRQQATALQPLWGALRWEGYHEVLQAPDAGGPTCGAYRAILKVPDMASLGRYSALLRLPEVAAVRNLMEAQRRLLRACGELLRGDGALVSSTLRRDGPVAAYWPFVLLYSARRGTVGKRPWPAGDESPPPRQPPGAEDWPALWAQTVAMDSPAVTPFLVERTRMQNDRPRILVDVVGELISSLEDQPREVLFQYYNREHTIPDIAQMLARPGGPSMLPEVQRTLLAFRQDLRQALSAHPATRVFLQPAAARAWEGFLQECLRHTWGDQNYLFSSGREQAYARSLQIHYGPAFDLICPRSWN